MNEWTTEIKQTREAALTAAWETARTANVDRHAAILRGDKPAARECSRRKTWALVRAFNLAPARVSVRYQFWNGNYHLLLNFRGEKLHLPLSFASFFGMDGEAVHVAAVRRGLMVA